MPIKVVLDTNVYSSDKFRLGQGFKTLSSLCKSGHVNVVLPHIVRREFETQLEANATEIVTSYEKSAKKLASGPIPDDLRGDLDKLVENFKTRKQEVIGSHKAYFSAWLEEHAVIDLPLNGDHAVAAMENYFSAGPPFQSAKKRDDIPDAMIYQSLVGLAKEGPVAFVCSDLKLANALSGIENISHCTDLNELIASDDVQAALSEQKAAAHAAIVLQRLEQLTSTSPNILTDYISEHGGEDLATTSFTSPSLPGDDREAYIYMFGNLCEVEFDWGRAAYHGDSVYVVPFSAEGEFNITYYVPKWDVEEIERRGGSYSYHNDYVVEADEVALLAIRGMLRIKISDVFEPNDELADAIDEISIDSLEDPILAEDLN